MKYLKKREIFSFIIFIGCIIFANSFCFGNTDENNNDIPPKYDLREHIDIVVKNQGPNDDCIPTSESTMIETFLKMKILSGEIDITSEDAVCSMLTLFPLKKIVPIKETNKIIEGFYDGKENFKTEAEIQLLEGETDNKDLLLEVEKIVPKYQIISQNDTKDKFYYMDAINKKINQNGILFSDEKGNELSEDDVKKIRDKYKAYIMKNGGIASNITSENIKSSKNIENQKNIKVCNTSDEVTSTHSIVIIGWDDNFSRLNFPEEIRPLNNGAYIVQNSWGESWGENGIFYVSYEDKNIEESLRAIDGVITADIESYDNSSPYITIEEIKNNKVIIRVSDKNGIGVDYFKYMYKEYDKVPNINSPGWETVKDNRIEIDGNKQKDLWIYAIDKNGNDIITVNGSVFSYLEAVSNLDYKCSETDDGSFILRIYTKEKDYLPEIGFLCNTLSDEEFEQNHTVEGNEHVYKISKVGKHTINVGEIFYGKPVFAFSETINIIDSSEQEINDTTKPEIINCEITGIKGLKGKAKIIVEAQDLQSRIKIIGLDGNNGNWEKEPVDGKAEFEITESGEYYIYVTNGANLTNLLKINVDDINKYYIEDDIDEGIDTSPDNAIVDENKYTYNIVEGVGQVYSGKDMIIIFDAPKEELSEILVNNKMISEGYEIIDRKNTAIVLKKEYLSTLKPHTYTLIAKYNNGNIIESQFKIPVYENYEENNDFKENIDDRESNQDGNINEDKKYEDQTAANGKIPQTGFSAVPIISIVFLLSIFAYIIYMKYRKLVIK